MEWQQVQSQVERLSGLFKREKINLEEYTTTPKHLVSLSSQLKFLDSFDKRSAPQIQVPTSGESSPCLSESEMTVRHISPSIFDLNAFAFDEITNEIDYDIEKLKDSTERDISILIEDLDKSVTIDQFLSLVSDVRIYNYMAENLFKIKNSKFIISNKRLCLLLQVRLEMAYYFPRYMRKLQLHIKQSTGRPVKISLVRKQKKKKKCINGVVLRNLPPKVDYDVISEQCGQEVNGPISIGPIHNIKQSNCCLVECDYLEDAEVICKKINKMQVRDPKTRESYVIKVASFLA